MEAREAYAEEVRLLRLQQQEADPQRLLLVVAGGSSRPARPGPRPTGGPTAGNAVRPRAPQCRQGWRAQCPSSLSC